MKIMESQVNTIVKDFENNLRNLTALGMGVNCAGFC